MQWDRCASGYGSWPWSVMWSMLWVFLPFLPFLPWAREGRGLVCSAPWGFRRWKLATACWWFTFLCISRASRGFCTNLMSMLFSRALQKRLVSQFLVFFFFLFFGCVLLHWIIAKQLNKYFAAPGGSLSVRQQLGQFRGWLVRCIFNAPTAWQVGLQFNFNLLYENKNISNVRASKLP